MKKYLIDFARFDSKKGVHREIKDAMLFYEGENLDALYDALTDISEETLVLLVNTASVPPSLGDYASATLETFLDAERENPYIKIKTT